VMMPVDAQSKVLVVAGMHRSGTSFLASLLHRGGCGMGEVLLATDGQIERDVAIKRMLLEPSPHAVARFVREAKIQGRLDHPAIVPVHELATDGDGRPFFVMKRLSGTTLAELLARDDSRSPRHKLLRAFADVCLAIELAHSRKVIHRDLKPANIMIDGRGRAKIADFGLAGLAEEIRSTKRSCKRRCAVLPTRNCYMSAESRRTRPISSSTL